LQTRPEDQAADDEYEAFMEFGGLDTHQLLRQRIHGGELPPIDFQDLSGLFLGGGPYCVTDPDNQKSTAQKQCELRLKQLLDWLIPADFPLLAACYIGPLLKHQNAKVSRQYPEVIGPYVMKKTDNGQSDKLLADLPDEFIAYSGHKESCEKLPQSSVNLVSSASCPYQMIRIKNNIYAVQFHPELNQSSLALRVEIYKNYGYFPPEDARDLIARARSQPAIQPIKILRNFVTIYRR
jgi:GMP synthase (glutamine-hydrolysing)